MSGAQFPTFRRWILGTPGMIAAIALLLYFAALVGYLLPSELRPWVPALRYIDGALTILFGFLSWEFFQLVVPARNFYFKKWRVIRMVCVPAIWTVLVLVFAICLGQIQDQYPYFGETICFPQWSS